MSWAAGDVINTTSRMRRLSESIPPAYTVWLDGTTYRAECNIAGGSDISGADARTVIHGALGALNASRPGKVLLREGLFSVDTTTIGMTVAGSELEGSGYGTELRLETAAMSGITVSADNCTIRNLRINGYKGTVASGHGIVVGTGINRPHIENVYVESPEYYGIYLYECNYGVVDNCTVYNGDRHGIAVEASTSDAVGNVITNCHLLSNGQTGPEKAGITCEGSRTNGFYPLDTLIQGNYVSGSAASDSYAGIALINSPRSIIKANRCINNLQGGIMISACENSTIKDNILENNDLGGNLPYRAGIRIDDTGVTDPSNDVTISGNQCSNHSDDGIRIMGIPNRLVISNNVCNANAVGITVGVTTGVTVVGNTCANNVATGILLSSCTDGSVLGNICYNNDAGGAVPYRSGIRIDDTATAPASTDIVIMGNRCFGHTDYGIILMGTSDRIHLKGNVCEGNTAGAYNVGYTAIGDGNTYDGVIQSDQVQINGATTIPAMTFISPAFLARAKLQYSTAVANDTNVTVGYGRDGAADADYYVTSVTSGTGNIWATKALTLAQNSVTAGDTVTFTQDGSGGAGEYIRLILAYLTGA